MNKKDEMMQDWLVPSADNVRQPIAVEVVRHARSVAARADALRKHLDVKLSPVIASRTPHICEEALKNEAEYPPLFLDLHNALKSIESALESIEYTLSLVEL